MHPGAIRVGDLERNQICDQLASHFSAGRLDQIELDVRLAAAVEARTWADLHRLVRDLPPLGRRPVATPATGGILPGLAAVGVVLAVVICLGMIALSGVLGVAVGFFSVIGGTIAAAGGVGIGYLIWGARPPAARRGGS